jgi:hypothetical protein
VYDFLSTICGINPASPGFATVSIRPAMGQLVEVRGAMPHPLGTIRVHLLRVRAHGVAGEVELPPGVSGDFYWEGKEVRLHGGINKIKE